LLPKWRMLNFGILLNKSFMELKEEFYSYNNKLI